MMEIELKILEIDVQKITEKILQLGGVLVTPERLVAAQKFDTPAADIQKKKDLFRIRKNGDVVEIVYKKNRMQDDGFRRAEEIQTTVGDWETIQQIIFALGFVPTQYQEKKRTTYALYDTLIEVDMYPNIPPYLEVEGAEENITKVVAALGYGMNDTSSLSASQVLESYGVDVAMERF